MIVVTGGAGFIGSNLVKALNRRGEKEILIVDHVGKGLKFKNLLGLEFDDIWSKQRFMKAILDEEFDNDDIEGIFHMGACSDTMEYNGDYMLRNNYRYTKELFHFCNCQHVPLIYASSASTYGLGRNGFREVPECEDALNPYAFSKLLFDRFYRSCSEIEITFVCGLRFFNVYGPQEAHKGRMASIFYQMYNQLKETGRIKLFKGIDGVADGEQRRDFIYVGDAVKICLWLFDNHIKDGVYNVPSGIYNCGTGHAHTYNEAAEAMILALGFGDIEYIDFPEVLKGKYQNYTQADMTKLLDAGYDGGFTPLKDAVQEYCDLLDRNGGYFFD